MDSTMTNCLNVKIRKLMLSVLQMEDKEYSQLYTYTNAIQEMLQNYKTQEPQQVGIPSQSGHITRINLSEPTIRLETEQHDRVLVCPRQQMTNTGIGDLDGFAKMVYGMASAALNSKTHSASNVTNLHETMFSRSFMTPEIGRKFHLLATTASKKHRLERPIILPPLILRSEINFTFDLPHMIIVCCSSGPMIPILRLSSVPACEQTILYLYSLHSLEYMNQINFVQILEKNNVSK